MKNTSKMLKKERMMKILNKREEKVAIMKILRRSRVKNQMKDQLL